jgi:hemoglobin
MTPPFDEAAIGALVRRFYGKARLDPLLGPVFEAGVHDWDEHIERITGFWSGVMLGTGAYKGNPLGMHARHAITPEMFPRWIALWGETAAELFDPATAAALRDRAERIGRSLSLGLFYRPDVVDAARGRSVR